MKILLALGANLPSEWGNPAETLSHAIDLLSERICESIQASRFYSTDAYPLGSGPKFVNAALALESDITSRHLLEICHEIENTARRRRDSRWGPRTLDIDIIAHGDLVLPSLETYETWRTLPEGEQIKAVPETLIVPHPRLQDRAFVLVPLCDVARDWVHPVLGQTPQQMLNKLSSAEIRGVTPLETP